MSQDYIHAPPYANLDENHVPQINYPDLSGYVPPPSYNSQQVIQNKEEDIKKTRIQYLINCYKFQALSFTIVLITQLLGLTQWFMQITTKFTKVRLFGYYQDYSYYLMRNQGSGTYEEYEEWRQGEYYIITRVRWTFYVILGFLVLNTLTILIGRFNQTILKYQKSLFYSQAVLIGLSLVGLTGNVKDNHWMYKDRCTITISINSILLLNSLVNLFLIKINKLHYYTKISNNLIYLQIPLNFVLILLYQKFEGSILLIESFVLYGFYYFNQLNNSLLMNPENLPAHTDFVQKIKNAFSSPQIQSNNTVEQIIQVNADAIIIRKKHLPIVIGIIYQIIMIVLIITTDQAIFWVLLILPTVQLCSFLFETQVASRQLEFDDRYISACMVYIDVLNPIKNLLRSLEITK